MNSYPKRQWQWFVYNALKAVFALARVVPLRAMLVLGTWLGVLGFRLSGRYRAVAHKNLTIAFGNTISEQDKRRITREVFINFSKASVAEFAATARMKPGEIRAICELDPQVLQTIKTLLARGKGLLGVSAHIGNFELMARRFAVEGYSFAVVVRNDGNQAMASLLNEIRTESGYEVIGRGEAAKPILKKLRDGGIVIMLPDQKSDDVFVPFFGTPTGTVAGPAVIALRTGAPILPVFCIRQPDDTHKMVIGDVIEPDGDDGDKEASIEKVMTRVNEEIEKIVRAYPEQWLWLHDRWRVAVPAEVMDKWEATHGNEGKVQPSTAC